MLRRRKRPVDASWRMDEIYILVGDQWKYLYRAVNRTGDTIDFLLCAHRDCAASRRFFERAMSLHGVPTAEGTASGASVHVGDEFTAAYVAEGSATPVRSLDQQT